MLEYILSQSKQRWLNAVEVDTLLSETNAHQERVQAPDMSQWNHSHGGVLFLYSNNNHACRQCRQDNVQWAMRADGCIVEEEHEQLLVPHRAGAVLDVYHAVSACGALHRRVYQRSSRPAPMNLNSSPLFPDNSNNNNPHAVPFGRGSMQDSRVLVQYLTAANALSWAPDPAPWAQPPSPTAALLAAFTRQNSQDSLVSLGSHDSLCRQLTAGKKRLHLTHEPHLEEEEPQFKRSNTTSLIPSHTEASSPPLLPQGQQGWSLMGSEASVAALGKHNLVTLRSICSEASIATHAGAAQQASAAAAVRQSAAQVAAQTWAAASNSIGAPAPPYLPLATGVGSPTPELLNPVHHTNTTGGLTGSASAHTMRAAGSTLPLQGAGSSTGTDDAFGRTCYSVMGSWESMVHASAPSSAHHPPTRMASFNGGSLMHAHTQYRHLPQQPQPDYCRALSSSCSSGTAAAKGVQQQQIADQQAVAAVISEVGANPDPLPLEEELAKLGLEPVINYRRGQSSSLTLPSTLASSPSAAAAGRRLSSAAQLSSSHHPGSSTGALSTPVPQTRTQMLPPAARLSEGQPKLSDLLLVCQYGRYAGGAGRTPGDSLNGGIMGAGTKSQHFP